MSFSHKISVEWKGNYRLTAKNESGVTANFDAPVSFGGEGSALTPMENLLASLASCSSIHVISTLKEQGQKISSYQVEIEGQRKEEHPRAFTKIQIKYVISGQRINKALVKKAIEEAESNYWSVGTMLKKAIPITSSFEIR